MRNVLEEAKRDDRAPAIIWVLTNPAMAKLFDRVVVFNRASWSRTEHTRHFQQETVSLKDCCHSIPFERALGQGDAMMLLKDEVGMLRRVPLFSGVEPAKLKLLAFTSDRVSYSAGQILFHQGDEGDAAYVILSGNADILVDSETGQIKVAEVEPNSIVGEIAILCDVSRTATVQAAGPLEACASARIISCGC